MDTVVAVNVIADGHGTSEDILVLSQKLRILDKNGPIWKLLDDITILFKTSNTFVFCYKSFWYL